MRSRSWEAQREMILGRGNSSCTGLEPGTSVLCERARVVSAAWRGCGGGEATEVGKGQSTGGPEGHGTKWVM